MKNILSRWGWCKSLWNSNYVFWLFEHLPIHNPKLCSMIPQQYLVRLVVGIKNFFNSGKDGARQDVSFNCLAHLQKNTADILPQDVSATASASSSRRKAREKISSPPEIHLTVLFLHEVLKQTRNMDTFGGIVSKTSSTLTTWNVVNNEVFHGQDPLIRPGKHNNTLWWARQLQIVASFVNGKTTWWSLLFEAQKERPSWTHFFHHGHVIARKHKDLVFSSSAKLYKKWCLCSDVWGHIFKRCWLSEPSCLSSFGPPENYMRNSMFGAFLFCPAWSQTTLHRKHLPDELVFGLGKSEPPLFWHRHQSKPPMSTEHTPPWSLAAPSG